MSERAAIVDFLRATAFAHRDMERCYKNMGHPGRSREHELMAWRLETLADQIEAGKFFGSAEDLARKHEHCIGMNSEGITKSE